MPHTPTRLLVADQFRSISEAIALGLDATGLAVEFATTPEQARLLAQSGQVSLAMLDIGLLAPDIRTSIQRWLGHPKIPIVVLGNDQVEREHDGLLRAAVRAGVRGWVPRSSPLSHLLAVLNGVLSGDTWIPPSLLTGLLRQLIEDEGDFVHAASLTTALTPREREVLGLMCAGLTHGAIAAELFVSPRTVRTHVQNVLTKLDVHSSLAAVALARRMGLAPEAHE